MFLNLKRTSDCHDNAYVMMFINKREDVLCVLTRGDNEISTCI